EEPLLTPRYKKFTRAHGRGGARRKNHDSERERGFVQDSIFCLCWFVDRDSHNGRPSAARKTMITSASTLTAISAGESAPILSPMGARTLARTFLEIPRLDNSSKTLSTFFLLPIIPI